MSDAAAISAGGDALEHVREVVARANTSFYWGMRVLPPERRNAMFAVYAFCREVDDIADGAAAEGDKRVQLAAWRDEIEALYEGRPTRTISKALLGPVRTYGLPKAEFLAMIDGMDTDAHDLIPGMTLDELKLYCRRVAGAVGMMSIPIFGDSSPTAQRLAVAQGEALQLTNILRDLAEDAARNRLYLPHELLDKHGIGTRVPAEVMVHPALGKVCHDLAILAEHQYRAADSLMDQCDRKAMKPARLMMKAYQAIFTRMQKRGWQRPTERVSVSPLAKLWIVFRYGVL